MKFEPSAHLFFSLTAITPSLAQSVRFLRETLRRTTVLVPPLSMPSAKLPIVSFAISSDSGPNQGHP